MHTQNPSDDHGVIHPQNLWQATTLWRIHKTLQVITVWSIHKTVRCSRYDPSTNPVTGYRNMMHPQNPSDGHGMFHPQILWQETTVCCINKTRQTITVWSIHKTVRRSRYDPSTNPVTGYHSMMHPQNQSDDHGMIHPQNLGQATTVWCIHRARQITTAAWPSIKPVSHDQSRMHPQNYCQRPHRMVHPQSLCQTYPKPNSIMTLEIAQSMELLPTVWTAKESSCNFSR